MPNRISVCIIEDDAIIAENIKFTLEDLGFDVTSICYTFQDAYQQLSKEIKSDIIISDINLGEGNERNGIQLIKKLKASETLPPVIFLTAYNDKATILEASEVNPRGYLIKPVNEASLFATISCAFHHEEEKTIPENVLIKEQYPDYFYTKLGNTNYKVMWRDIIKIESSKNYVKAGSSDGKEWLIRGSLNKVYNNMIPIKLKSQFKYINRSLIVQEKIIMSFDSEEVNTTIGKFHNTQYQG